MHEYTNGETYNGEWKYAQRYGQGAQTYTNGDIYNGEWKDDMRNGQGTYTYANGGMYVGEFKDGRRDGQGTFTPKESLKQKEVGGWKDDDLYNGFIYREYDSLEIKNGKVFRRKQSNTYGSGDTYEGWVRNGKKDGQGTYNWNSGGMYVGEWKDGDFNGQGARTYKSGDIHVGEWKDDMKNGQGTYTYANGETLTGEFRGDYIKTRTLSVSDEEGCYEERFREVTRLSTVYKSIKRQYRGLPSSYSYLSQNLTDEYYKDVKNADKLYELCKGGFTSIR